MPITADYIKMCDHPLIQATWEPKRGDNYILGTSRTPGDKHFAVLVLGCCWEKCVGCTVEVNDLRYECLFLPRPDQWLEMLPAGALELDVFRTDSGGWQILSGDYHSTGYHDSFKQALAAFVMHKMHGLEWDGDKWTG